MQRKSRPPAPVRAVVDRDPLGDMRFHKQIEDCVSAYKQAGYVVVGDSDR